MSSAMQLVRDSSTPLAYRENAALAVFAEAFVRGVLKRLARCAAADAEAATLAARCTDMAGGGVLATAAAWQPELGACMAHMQRGQPLDAAVQALFALHALGAPGSWALAPARPLRASMGGHGFALAGRVELRAEAGRVALRRSDIACAPLAFAHDGRRWHLAGPAADPWRHVGPAFFDDERFAGCYVHPWLPPSAMGPGQDLLVDWPPEPADARCTALAAEAAQQSRAVLALLEQAGPAYLAWLRPLMRGIAACPVHTPGMRISASFPNHLGVISAAFPLRTAYLAEILVHEFSHQYYLLLDAVAPLVKKEAQPTLYYSSFKMKQRPLGKILLTYHATANMALFWHGLYEHGGACDPLYRDELDKLLLHTDSLGAIIAASGGLTGTGAAMFDTQRTLLAARDLTGCGA